VIRLLTLAALCTAPVISGAQAPSYPACRIEQHAPVAFSSSNATDTLKVSVIGTPCFKGRLNIEIISQGGVRLYKYSAEFKRHTSLRWDDADMPQIAEDFVKRILHAERQETSDLPPWLPKGAYYEQNYETIEITKERYDSIRKQALPIFRHPTHYEEWRRVIYDAGKRKAVVILTGGV
jgi:hypothetical protein